MTLFYQVTKTNFQRSGLASILWLNTKSKTTLPCSGTGMIKMVVSPMERMNNVSLKTIMGGRCSRVRARVQTSTFQAKPSASGGTNRLRAS